MFSHDVSAVQRVIVEASRRLPPVPRTLAARKRSGKLAVHVRPITIDVVLLKEEDGGQLRLRCEGKAAELHSWIEALAHAAALAQGHGWASVVAHAQSAPDVVAEHPPIVYNSCGQRRASALRVGERATVRLAPALHACFNTRTIDASWCTVDARVMASPCVGSN